MVDKIEENKTPKSNTSLQSICKYLNQYFFNGSVLTIESKKAPITLKLSGDISIVDKDLENLIALIGDFVDRVDHVQDHVVIYLVNGALRNYYNRTLHKVVGLKLCVLPLMVRDGYCESSV